LLLAGYVNGAASLARLGLDGSGRIYLLVVPIFTTVLVGMRAGLLTSLVSIAIYAFFLLRAPAPEQASWAEAGIALAAFILATVILLARFVQFQLRILRQEQQARAGLEAAQAELRAYSQTLEEKVLQRTALLAEAKEAAEAASRRFEEELLFAGRIQASFMAAHLPPIPSWETGAALVPARETSGDFYDVFPLPDGRYGVLIADVVDKGVGAALIMALCWALLHTYARRFPDEPLRVLEATNRRILRDTQAEQFVTVFYGVLDPHMGTLHYANAGHPPPYHCHGEHLSALPRTGPPIGIVEDVRWTAQTVQFVPGDLCMLYTDGVTEAQNEAGEFFEERRLAAVLRDSAGRSAGEIKGAVLDQLARFVGDVPQADDITLVVLTYSSPVALEGGDESGEQRRC
jgi:serine phosphatase RsbU (regulator of sigma subunit)